MSRQFATLPHWPVSEDEILSRYAMPEPNSGCWIWLRPLTPKGYGLISVNRRSIGAHRYTWSLRNRQRIPKGAFVLHSCDNPCCVNPDHLRLGDVIMNAADMMERGRHKFSPQPGARNGRAVLTPTQVEMIRSSTQNYRIVSQRLGVDRTTVSKIRRGLLWSSHTEALKARVLAETAPTETDGREG